MAAIEPTAELVRQAYAAIQDGEMPPEIGDPEVISRAIQERIKAGTFDQSLNPTEQLTGWADDYLDKQVTVLGFHLNRSTFVNQTDPDKKGVYAAVELINPDGQIVTVGCGGNNVLIQLVKAWEERRFPFSAALVSTSTGSGNTTYWLKRTAEKS
jgi:hypothetical protein